MNKLPPAKRAAILTMLCEGASMRSVSRMADVSINTVSKLLVDAGEACMAHHDETVRGVNAKRVQCDEIWSFCYAKAKNVATAKAAPEEAGDVWTWTALDADSKLIISYLISGRDAGYAAAFMDDVADRLANRVQLTTDGHKAYLTAVEGAFGADVGYAMLVKVYGDAPDGAKGRYSPADCTVTHKIRIERRPDAKHVSTSYVERQNLTMRMHMRRFTRLTNGFSKKGLPHAHMVALYTCWYNFVRIHKTLRCTPAMAAGVTDRLWSMEDVVALLDAREAPPAKRGPYKPRQAKAVSSSTSLIGGPILTAGRG
ncbi:IS1 family transposase [Roseomonas sp. CCTCC AB2023176]|uniref:IS1 family transposase n=1 Tax=Roseomonas sp. CCTCC AB2023176 TaxID=3342640 RepID=UPI0035D72A76